MIVDHIDSYNGGWFIGNFEPTLLRTTRFEVGLKHHPKDSFHATHYHKVAHEYNLLMNGVMVIQGQELHSGDIFVFEPGEISDPKFITDCDVLTIKIPSVPGDKYEVNSPQG